MHIECLMIECRGSCSSVYDAYLWLTNIPIPILDARRAGAQDLKKLLHFYQRPGCQALTVCSLTVCTSLRHRHSAEEHSSPSLLQIPVTQTASQIPQLERTLSLIPLIIFKCPYHSSGGHSANTLPITEESMTLHHIPRVLSASASVIFKNLYASFFHLSSCSFLHSYQHDLLPFFIQALSLKRTNRGRGIWFLTKE